MRVWRLEPLTDDEVGAVVRRALDRRGPRPRRRRSGRPAASRSPTTPSTTSSRSPAATRARRSTSSRARPRWPKREDIRDEDGHVSPRLEDVEAAAQQRILAYDRAGDGHYDTVSAFIKSLRGNDPDAALYWLAAMIAAGEDPQVHRPAADHQRVRGRRQRRPAGAVGGGRGGPGARLDRAARGAIRARPGDDVHRHGAEVEPVPARPTGRPSRDVEANGALPVPLHLRNAAHRGMKQHGIGVGYRYSHDYEGADVEQQYLPDAIVARRYYLPTDQGYESTIAARMAARADARAAAKAAGKTPRAKTPAPEVTPPRGRRDHEDARDEPQEAGRDREARRRKLGRRASTRRERDALRATPLRAADPREAEPAGEGRQLALDASLGARVELDVLVDRVHLQDARLAVGRRVDLADQLVAVEDRQREIAPAPLVLRLVHLEQVVEVEQLAGPGPVVGQAIERRQQRGSSRRSPRRSPPGRPATAPVVPSTSAGDAGLADDLRAGDAERPQPALVADLRALSAGTTGVSAG